MAADNRIKRELPPGCVVVKVNEIIDPTTFWVSEPWRTEGTFPGENLSHLEEMLSKEFCSNHYRPNFTNHLPEVEEMVAVKNTETGQCHRGMIKNILHTVRGYIYNVFLVDYGCSLNVSSTSIRELPKKMLEMKWQAYRIMLYGVLPTSIDANFEEMKIERVICSKWTAAAEQFVRKIVKRSQFACFELKQAHRKKLGDLYLYLDDNFVNLSDVLCEQEYAIKDHVLFEGMIEVECSASIHGYSSGGLPSESDVALHYTKTRIIEEYVKECRKEQDVQRQRNREQIIEWREETEKAMLDEDVDNFSDLHEEPSARNSHLTYCPINKDERVKHNSLLELLSKRINNSTRTEKEDAQHKELRTLDKKVEDAQPVENVAASGTEEHDVSAVSLIKLLHLKEKRKSERLGMSSGVINSLQTDKDTPPNNIKTEKISSPPRNFIPAGCNLNMLNSKKSFSSSKVSLIKSGRQKESTNAVSSQSSGREETKADSKVLCKSVTSVVSMCTDTENNVENNNVPYFLRCIRQLQKTPVSELPNCAQSGQSNTVTNGDIIPSSERQSTLNLSSYEPEPIVLPSIEDTGLRPRPHTTSTITDRLQASNVLVHTESKRCVSIVSVAEAQFPTEIHKALSRCGFHDPMRIQKHVWPSILRGENVIMVSPPRSGKTLAYAAPLVGFLFQESTYKDMPPGCGPLVLILCSSSSSAQNVYNVCNELKAGHEKPSVLLTYGGGAEMEQKVALANGCDILISTPRCLLRLIACSKFVTNLKRMVHLVLDEADVLSLKYLPEMKELLAQCTMVLKKRKNEVYGLQFIASAQKWCPALESLTHIMPKPPTICIASCLEGAVYARLQPCLHFIDDTTRITRVQDILKQQQGMFKTVVVCENSEEVIRVADGIKSICGHLLIGHEDMSHLDLNGVLAWWRHASQTGLYPVLVCSDDVLNDFQLRDASWLIHYSLPSESKTLFGSRFACLMDNYRNLLKKENNTPECSVHILLSNTSPQLPSIVQLMKRLGAKIDHSLEELASSIQKQREFNKEEVPLCYNLKAFGDCWDKSSCLNRHLIRKDRDAPEEHLPMSGVVKLKVLYVHDACNFSARLLEHTNLEGNTVPLQDQFYSINFKLNKHYSDTRNRIPHGIPKLNDICAVEARLNIFKRVQVVSFTILDANNNPKEVQVRYLDDGNREEVKVLKLLSLPEDLQKVPFQVVEVFLCRLSPCDMDWSWGQAASLKVLHLILEVNNSESDDLFLLGKIALSLSNTLWLDPLECRRVLPTVGTSSIVFSLRHNLLREKLAVENPYHTKRLYTLCKDAEMEVPEYEIEPEVSICEQPQHFVPIQWAFLPIDEQYPKVYFTSADHPGNFFVRLVEREDNLERMVKMLQKVAREDKGGSQVLHTGAYCLGKFPDDGLWYRAQVLSTEDNKVSLFFVDHGDKAVVQLTDTLRIPDYWLTHLPLQAIECTLAGVQPTENEVWSEDAVNALYSLTADEDDDKFVKTLYVKVCEKLKSAMCTGRFRYKVVLVNTAGNVLNQLLVDMGLATLIDDEKHLLQDIVLPQSNSPPLSSAGDTDSDFSETETTVVKNISENEVTWLMPNSNSCVEAPSNDKIKAEQNEPETAIASLSSFDFSNFDVDVEDLMDFMEDLKKTFQNSKSDEKTTVKIAEKKEVTESESSESKDTELKDINVPPLINTVQVPQVLWCQNGNCVWIKISLIGVENYYICWNIKNVEFCTVVNDKTFYLNMNLFGAIIPAELVHTAQGQYVSIKLYKLVPGFRWECLLKVDEKWPPWLKYDFGTDKSSIDMARRMKLYEDDLKPLLEKAEEHEKTNIKADIMLDSEEEYDSGSDIIEPGDEQYDPYNPLN